ncbi:Peptide methionine sulfoxide reductase MsrB [Jannaschia seosinensis]|uniref:peptide-methionine (R)-S-oxide reductase n=1 Tax=Jannaschia seosinensis TaxID=313367 RepID=A0A0M7BD51_9RHOB|nr:peptide-methionine (R)-S-oxide reductase MsrB [Jannaschia seosinensis]CUH39754.1 Peptide methionine sulfoxide reductase MsrB [Jannaschia seosinensis]
MPSRRNIIVGGATLAAAGAVAGGAALMRGPALVTSAQPDGPPVSLPPEEWADRLTPAEYAVLREEETEPPYSSPLNDFWEAGTYICAGCANPVYASQHKYESGTGWPSFWRAISPAAIGTRVDYKLVFPRTEVHCARCGGHFGHIFEDGPSPTGLRHCLNGIALDFVPSETA